MVRIMRRIGSLFAACLALLAERTALSAASEQAPDFREVYDVIRTNLAGVSEAELNRTAVNALVTALSPKVSLVTGEEATSTTSSALVTRSGLFDGAVAYLRVGRVEDGLAQALREAYGQAVGTNGCKGVALDLRYAGGTDYAAAAAAADLFLSQERPLLDSGKGMVRSKAKPDPLPTPVAVLVNRRTAGGAEVLAAVLRETGVGLVLGSQTAGQAMVMQDYPLQNGDRLRLASVPVRLGDGSTLPTGVKPDIDVEVKPDDERAYYADAFKELIRTNLTSAALASNSTNRARRPRLNEAELVRERKEGFNPDLEEAADDEPEQPLVRDPVLARALDLLKGLAVVRQSRS